MQMSELVNLVPEPLTYHPGSSAHSGQSQGLEKRARVTAKEHLDPMLQEVNTPEGFAFPSSREDRAHLRRAPLHAPVGIDDAHRVCCEDAEHRGECDPARGEFRMEETEGVQRTGESK